MSWNTTDPDGVASSSIKIDDTTYAGNGPWTDATSGVNFTRPISSLAAGVHNYTITAVDKAGNSSTLTGSFTIAGAPVVTGSGPVISRVAVSQAAGFMSWNTTDPDGVASSSIKIDTTTYAGNGPWVDATSGVNYTRPISSSGGRSSQLHYYRRGQGRKHLDIVWTRSPSRALPRPPTWDR